MKRVFGFFVLGVLALAVISAGSAAAWVWSTLPSTNTTIEAPTIKAPVTVLRDGAGVPHIFAKSDGDAYYALGFVHAQDRFWQMEMMRRLGTGRLAEVLGPDAVASDRWMRTLGIRQLAEEQFQALSKPVQAALESYAQGVNARLRHAQRFPWGVASPEFALLRYKPEPWRPVDSLIWGKVMAMRLSGNWRDEILRARLARKLAPTQVGQLWPLYPDDAPQTIETAAALTRSLDLDRMLAAAPLPPGLPRGASNAWALRPAKTETRGAILANDPHLRFSAPIVWYFARIETPDMTVTGATVPGVPFTILGHNADLAWGITSTRSDTQDLYVEQTDDDGKRYQTPDGWSEFEVREETIAVRGAPPVKMTIRKSRHGPIISDVDSGIAKAASPGAVIALRATYQDRADTTPQAFYELNRAEDWDGFVAALKEFLSPHSNFVFADKQGNIGFIAPGRVPIRNRGWGLVPSAGWDGETDWAGYITFGELPRVFNPPSDRVVNANNRSIPTDYRHFITFDWAPGYRATRIVELVDAKRQTVHNTGRVQQDTVSEMARHLLPLMTGAEPDGAIAEKALELLKKWDGTMSRAKAEPLIFSTWLLELNRAIYADELDAFFNEYVTLRPQFIAKVLNTNQAWCDNVNSKETEDCNDRLRVSLKRAVDKLSAQWGPDIKKWRWGDVHRAEFDNRMLSALPFAKKYVDLEIDSDGGNYTVNRGATRVSDPKQPFRHVHGPGFRAVYDLADLRRSRFIIATGQSGNVFSPHYGDLMTDWRDGRYIQLNPSRDVLTNNASATMVLIPAARQ